MVGRSPEEARHRVVTAVEANRLEVFAQPVFADLIRQCQNEIGLACFGTSPDNQVLWQRYGGCGAGVCVELDVPDDLLGTQLFRVQYLGEKRIHVDQLVRAFLDQSRAAGVYALALLSKPLAWADEAEIRFVSRRQAVQVVIDGSQIARLLLGDSLSPGVAKKINEVAGAVPVASLRDASVA